MPLGNLGEHLRECGCDFIGEHGRDRIFGREVSCIHQRQTDGLRTLHEIVAAVADDERLCAACSGIVHQLAAGTAPHRSPRDRLAPLPQHHTPRHPATRPVLEDVVKAESVLDVDALVEKALAGENWVRVKPQ